MGRRMNSHKALRSFQKDFCFKTISISEKERIVLLQAMAILEREAIK